MMKRSIPNRMRRPEDDSTCGPSTNALDLLLRPPHPASPKKERHDEAESDIVGLELSIFMGVREVLYLLTDDVELVDEVRTCGYQAVEDVVETRVSDGPPAYEGQNRHQPKPRPRPEERGDHSEGLEKGDESSQTWLANVHSSLHRLDIATGQSLPNELP